jgi:hypothetical protein
MWMFRFGEVSEFIDDRRNKQFLYCIGFGQNQVDLNVFETILVEKQCWRRNNLLTLCLSLAG